MKRLFFVLFVQPSCSSCSAFYLGPPRPLFMRLDIAVVRH